MTTQSETNQTFKATEIERDVIFNNDDDKKLYHLVLDEFNEKARAIRDEVSKEIGVATGKPFFGIQPYLNDEDITKEVGVRLKEIGYTYSYNSHVEVRQTATYKMTTKKGDEYGPYEYSKRELTITIQHI